MVTNYSDLMSEHSESLQSLTTHGGKIFDPSASKYVIHTHTVPLATTLDNDYLLDKSSKHVTVFHGYESGEDKRLCCSNRSCMYVRKDKTRVREKLATNCPCLQVKGIDGEQLRSLCWMVYVRSLNHNLANPSEESRIFDPREVMFCQTSSGVFDNSYGGTLRDICGATGWNHIEAGKFKELFSCIYWYRKFDPKFNFTKRLVDFDKKRGLFAVKRVITQSFHTINSLLLKKMIAFSPEICDYRRLAEQTARAFNVLMDEYMCDPVYRFGKLVDPEPGFYTELKEVTNFVKSSFHREKRSDRISWLDHTFKCKALGAILGTEMHRLRSYIEGRFAEAASDYSLSPAYMFRCSIIAQTRAMGYLPDAIAEVRRMSFRANVNREFEKPRPELLRFQYVSVQEALKLGGIPKHFMADGYHPPTARERAVFEDVFSRVELPLKGSASTTSLVKEGGKIEDARALLNLAIRFKWQIPVRDLYTHQVLEWIEVRRETDLDTDFTRPLFWISYAIVLNHWITCGKMPKSEFTDLPYGTGQYEPPIFNAKIVHISEPGKERNLTKSSAELAWFLTPGSKLIQSMLAHLPEHRAGLLESNHEWRHQKRIAVTSDEASFIYDTATGKTADCIRHAFKDWTESTDFIGKMVGWAHLKGAMDYADFPTKYRDLILLTIVERQPVTEVVVHRSFEDGTSTSEPIAWHGFINEGYMMGNPMTKSILHLVHDSERMCVREFLRRKGLVFKPPHKAAIIANSYRIDRQIATSAQISVLENPRLIAKTRRT